MRGLPALLLFAWGESARQAAQSWGEKGLNTKILLAANVTPGDKGLNPLVYTLKEFEVCVHVRARASEYVFTQV
jgi:hypothetical protein